MGIINEFKEFAIKGNVIDLAVGVIIGGAFGKITNSVVSDIVMPPLGLLISGIDFKDIVIPLKPAVIDATGKVTTAAVSMQVGNLIQVLFEFTIMAFVIFLMVKFINKLKRKQEPVAVEVVEPATPPPQEVLLSEIRDLLKQNGKS
ncbi:MAG: large conductance mechanosensitive channel protein MscL [Candidatus Melainabacteria bacterium HGW-Melainabacteria-1]|nr:MAG: large conductance mechanosensitive channel protein MscL [Candidatus Melainabacteria bacterium HGW-Melainabacteria-1]